MTSPAAARAPSCTGRSGLPELRVDRFTFTAARQVTADARRRRSCRSAVAPWCMRLRVIARRSVVLAIAAAQIGLVARGYWSDHKEFAFQMFPESSTWRADVVRVTSTGPVSIQE